MASFERMAIIGVGLLGGSLALSARERNLVQTITGFGRNQDTLKRAKEKGVIDDWSADLGTAVKDCDLVVLCSPVGTFLPRLKEMKSALKPGCIVTDVGSVKGDLVRAMEAELPEGTVFVGAHPIAGSERSGLDSAFTELFEGARCIVTPTAKTPKDACDRIISFWSALGMEVISMDPDEHDRVLGAVSHLPHVVAFALMNTVANVTTKTYDDVLCFSGGGLRDITRIASSDPVMWRDIALSNQKQVLTLIDEFQVRLDELKNMITRQDAEPLEEAFATANKNRLKLAKVHE